MSISGHIFGEFVALLAAEPNVETLSDEAVQALANEACRKYRFRPSKNLARRICERASREIAVRRKGRKE